MTTEVITAAEVRTAATALLDQAVQNPEVAAELKAASDQRWGAAEDIRKLRGLVSTMPQLPEAKATDIYYQVVHQERGLASPDGAEAGYDVGTAKGEDDLAVFGHGSLILDAHHATNPIRRESGKREAADHGTGGLAGVLALEGYGVAVIPRGLQTGNGNVDEGGEIKRKIATLVRTDTHDGFVSVHGMMPGKVVNLRDRTEVHAVIGLGANARERSIAAAERVVREAHDTLGLRVIIGNNIPHLNYAKDPSWDGEAFRNLSDEVARNKAGELAIGRLAAVGGNNMATYVNGLTADRPGFGVAQIELSRSLRLTPIDQWVRPDPSAERMGVYMGYLFCTMAANILTDHGSIQP
ncbi:MAG TPA: hypothetical protein VLF43_01290 [Candidatus Saccharimonadales bacterium]|nr:hypothetical protein [Candidatus Saccharimonadales bacterium]